MQDTIITFVRTMVAAGVAEAVMFMQTQNLFTATPDILIKGVVLAFIAGIIHAAAEYLRSQNPAPVPVSGKARGVARGKHWSHYLPV